MIRASFHIIHQPAACSMESRSYTIRLRTVLSTDWHDRFAPMKISHREPGITELYGILPDQSALHGILRQIQRFGLDILSIESESLSR